MAVAGRRTRDLAAEFVDFTHDLDYDAISPHAIERVKQAVLDSIGSALAARDADGIAATLAVMDESGSAGNVAILGSRRTTSLQAATIVNTTMTRALELDDVHEQALMHPSVAAIPSGLALADWLGGVDGRTFLTAVAGGMEVACRLGLTATYHSMGPLQKPRNFSFTYQCATFGAALAAARLLQLSKQQTLDALGNAYSQVSGVQQVLEEYTLIVRTQQGLSAWDGTLAALLARRGVTGPHEVFEGRFGYFNAYFGGDYDRAAAVDGLGERWEVERISVKPYPVCKVGHPAVMGTLVLVERHGIAAADIAGIEVRLASREVWDRMCFPLEVKQDVNDSVTAQFSLPFALAAIATRRRLTLEELTDGFLDPAIRDLTRRVRPVLDEPDGSTGRVMPMPVVVAITLRDGTVHQETFHYPRGHPENPMPWDEVVGKFEDCTRFGYPDAAQEHLDAITASVTGLEALADVHAVTAATQRLDTRPV